MVWGYVSRLLPLLAVLGLSGMFPQGCTIRHWPLFHAHIPLVYYSTEQRHPCCNSKLRGHSHSSSGCCMSPTKLRARLCAVPAALAATGDPLALPGIAGLRLSLLGLVACGHRLLVLLLVLLFLCLPVTLQCLVDPLHCVVQLCFGGLHLLLCAVARALLLQVVTERSEGFVTGCLRMQHTRMVFVRQKAC